MTEQQTTPPQNPPTSFAFSVTEFLDDVGRRIIHRKLVIGTAPKDFTEFVGMNQIIVRVGGPNGTQEPSAYRFPIDGVKTLEEAFALWDQLAHSFGQMHVAELRNQYRAMQQAQAAAAQGLVVPTPGQARKILLPDDG